MTKNLDLFLVWMYTIYNDTEGIKNMKYRIYDNNKNELLVESDDMYAIELFITLNPSGNLLYFHKENNIFIMWYECYTIFYKPM